MSDETTNADFDTDEYVETDEEDTDEDETVELTAAQKKGFKEVDLLQGQIDKLTKQMVKIANKHGIVVSIGFPGGSNAYIPEVDKPVDEYGEVRRSEYGEYGWEKSFC